MSYMSPSTPTKNLALSPIHIDSYILLSTPSSRLPLPPISHSRLHMSAVYTHVLLHCHRSASPSRTKHQQCCSSIIPAVNEHVPTETGMMFIAKATQTIQTFTGHKAVPGLRAHSSLKFSHSLTPTLTFDIEGTTPGMFHCLIDTHTCETSGNSLQPVTTTRD